MENSTLGQHIYRSYRTYGNEFNDYTELNVPNWDV